MAPPKFVVHAVKQEACKAAAVPTSALARDLQDILVVREAYAAPELFADVVRSDIITAYNTLQQSRGVQCIDGADPGISRLHQGLGLDANQDGKAIVAERELQHWLFMARSPQGLAAARQHGCFEALQAMLLYACGLELQLACTGALPCTTDQGARYLAGGCGLREVVGPH
jgi:hypothetical protein